MKPTARSHPTMSRRQALSKLGAPAWSRRRHCWSPVSRLRPPVRRSLRRRARRAPHPSPPRHPPSRPMRPSPLRPPGPRQPRRPNPRRQRPPRLPKGRGPDGRHAALRHHSRAGRLDPTMSRWRPARSCSSRSTMRSSRGRRTIRSSRGWLNRGRSTGRQDLHLQAEEGREIPRRHAFTSQAVK